MVANRSSLPGSGATSPTKTTWSPGSCVMPSLTPRDRSGTPMKRPPHIVGSRSPRAASDKASELWYMSMAKEASRDQADLVGNVALVGAPNLPPEDLGIPARPQSRAGATLDPLAGRTSPPLDTGDQDRRKPARPLWESKMSDSKEEGGPSCAGGQAPRPDTCYMTHVFVKREIAHLSRRVDEISRYFIALEQMVGTGAIGPLLNKSLHELEAKIEVADALEDIDEVQGLIDAAVRLGISPKRYAPLRVRLTWLESGSRREELRRRLAELQHDTNSDEANDGILLQQLIDNATRLGVDAPEIAIARRRLKEVEQKKLDQDMLAAASRGDIPQASHLVERGANTCARTTQGGYSLWHLAAVSDNANLAAFAARLDVDVHQTDDMGHTAVMAAAMKQNSAVLQQLLARGAKVDTPTLPVEHLVECADKAAVEKVCAPFHSSTDCRLLHTFQINDLHFDVGDRLVGGDDLHLPVFRRVAGRTALHLVVARAGREGAEVPIAKILLDHEADVNASDELGRTPLWYAAQAGLAGSVRILLWHGASATVGGGVSPLLAAARSHALVSSSGNSASMSLELIEVLRLLLQHGAGSEIRDATQFFNGDTAVCREASGLHDALEMSGGTPRVLNELREEIRACQASCAGRLLLQHGPRLTSAADAAALAATALPDFEALALRLARMTGGRVVFCQPPTATRVTRYARAAGLVHDSAVDWYRVTGVVNASLIYQDIPSLHRALRGIEHECSHHMRGLQDRLLVPALGARGGLSLLLEVSGVLCSLSLSLAHVVELEERTLADGRWMREELSSAITQGSLAQVIETMEYAEEHIETLRIAQILRAPLSTVAYSPTGAACGAPASLSGDPAVCLAVRTGQTNILDFMLKSDADPNVCSVDGTSALMLASLCRNISCFWMLLSSGADPSSVNFDRVRGGDFKAEARRMITQVSTQRSIDGIALAELVETFDGGATMLKEAKRLLQAGTDANTWTTGNGPTGEAMPLLSCATRQGSMAMVLLLIKFGAHVRGTAGPHSALRLSQGTPVEVMISRRANEEMQLAIASSDVAAIHKLLEAGVDPAFTSSDALSLVSKTLVEFAVDLPVELGLPLLEDLLQRGANVDQLGSNGQTVLLSLMQAGGSIEFVEVLLKRGADPSFANPEGITAFMIAASKGSRSAITLLLEAGRRKGVDVGCTTDLLGRDAMMHALIALQADIVDMLLVRDYVLSKQGALAQIFAACRDANHARLECLLDIVAPAFPKIASASEDGSEGMARPTKPTLLMEAVRCQHIEMVQMLLDHGAFLYPHHMFQAGIADLGIDGEIWNTESAWSLVGENGALRTALRSHLAAELLGIAHRNHSDAAANLQLDEALGLIASADDFQVLDAEGFSALDYALFNRNEYMEVWFTSRGARFQSERARNTALLDPAKSGDLESISRRISAGAEIHALDSLGHTALDWCVIASGISGQLWLCVENAIEIALANSLDMAHMGMPPIGERLSRHGSSRCSISAGSSFSNSFSGILSNRYKGDSSFRDISTSTSLGSSIRAHFNLDDNEVIEIGQASRPTAERSTSLSGVGPQGSQRNLLSVDCAMSVSMNSRNSYCSLASGSASARSGGGHSRRKKADPTPDPRGVHRLVEEVLVEAGVRFGEKVRKAKYVVWEPLMARDLDTVRRRILAGADCTLLNDKGIALTHLALDIPSPTVATALVQAGASPDHRDHRDRTVLWRAVETKQMELAEVCIAHGANLQLGIAGSSEGSLAHLALETKQPELVIKLLRAPKGCSPNSISISGRTLVWRAVELAYTDVVRECLQHKADLSTVDSLTGNHILHLALEVIPELVPELIDARAEVDVSNICSKTPLQIAARRGDKRAVEAIVGTGQVHLGRFGGIATVEAIENGHLELAARLIEVAGPKPPLKMSTSFKRTISKDSAHHSDGSEAGSDGGKSSVSCAPSAASGASSTSFSRSGKRFMLLEKQAVGEVLSGAVDAGSTELVTLFFTNALNGASIEREYAQDLAQDVTTWIFEGDDIEDKQARTETMQDLPYLIYQEGSELAASEYVNSLPEKIIHKITMAPHEDTGRRRRGSGCQARSSLIRRNSLEYKNSTKHCRSSTGGTRLDTSAFNSQATGSSRFNSNLTDASKVGPQATDDLAGLQHVSANSGDTDGGHANKQQDESDEDSSQGSVENPRMPPDKHLSRTIADFFLEDAQDDDSIDGSQKVVVRPRRLSKTITDFLMEADLDMPLSSTPPPDGDGPAPPDGAASSAGDTANCPAVIPGDTAGDDDPAQQ